MATTKSTIKRSATSLFGLGGLAVAFGITAIAWPGLTALSFVLMWGLYALVDGATALIAAFKEKAGRAWHIFSGVLGIVAGFVAVARPFQGTAVLAWVLGVWLIARGIAEIISIAAVKGMGAKLALSLSGVLWIIAGVIVTSKPLASAVGLAWMFGLFAIGWGITLIIGGLQVRKEDKASSTSAESAA